MTRNGAPGIVPALVFGDGITALGVVRVLHSAGIPTHVIGENPRLVASSRWYRPGPPSDSGVAPDSDLVRYLEELPFSRAVLIPCSDSWAVRIARLEDRFADRFPASIAPPSVLTGLMDKGQLARALCVADIPRPYTVPLEAASDLAGTPDALLAHGFLKPRDSEHFFRCFGTKAFWVRSREDAARRWQEAWRAGQAVMFQEYIPGPPDCHFFLDGFVDSAGHIAAMFARQRLRMYPSDFGNSTLMVSVPLDRVAAARESLSRLLELVNYRGIFSAEFKKDGRDGLFKLLEVNVRPWWYVEFAARSGVDVVTMAYRDALGLEVQPVTTYQVGRRCAYLYYDYGAYRDLRRRGSISFLAWVASLFGASQPLFRWSDPDPAWHEVRSVLTIWARRRVRRAIRWADPRPAWGQLCALAKQASERTAV